MKKSTHAVVECFIDWQSQDAHHREWRYFPKLDFWRDLMPEQMTKDLSHNEPGILFTQDIEPGTYLPGLVERDITEIPSAILHNAFTSRKLQGPYKGRFYPKGFLSGIRNLNNIFAGDMTPFRTLEVNTEKVLIDLNHPLAGKPLTLGAKVCEFLEPREQHGGICNDIIASLSEKGPGMQGISTHGSTDFFHDNSLLRIDDSEDSRFYSQTRMVNHLDEQARKHVNRLYRDHINSGMAVLDLMSSHDSHLEGIGNDVSITGLGMNKEELTANKLLKSYDIWDLNSNPMLPYEDNSYDVVVCTVSVEYLVKPVEVFTQVARILKPGGKFIVTFSDRWFPAKVIELWTELHPYERVGLILEYLRMSGRFHGYFTESLRGWPRPEDDPHILQRHESDPVFCVIAEKK